MERIKELRLNSTLSYKDLVTKIEDVLLIVDRKIHKVYYAEDPKSVVIVRFNDSITVDFDMITIARFRITCNLVSVSIDNQNVELNEKDSYDALFVLNKIQKEADNFISIISIYDKNISAFKINSEIIRQIAKD